MNGQPARHHHSPLLSFKLHLFLSTHDWQRKLPSTPESEVKKTPIIKRISVNYRLMFYKVGRLVKIASHDIHKSTQQTHSHAWHCSRRCSGYSNNRGHALLPRGLPSCGLTTWFQLTAKFIWDKETYFILFIRQNKNNSPHQFSPTRK